MKTLFRSGHALFFPGLLHNKCFDFLPGGFITSAFNPQTLSFKYAQTLPGRIMQCPWLYYPLPYM